MSTTIYLFLGLILIGVAFGLKRYATSFSQSAKNVAAMNRHFKQMWVTYTLLGSIGIIFGLLSLFGFSLAKWIAIVYLVIILLISMFFGFRFARQL